MVYIDQTDLYNIALLPISPSAESPLSKIINKNHPVLYRMVFYLITITYFKP